MVLSGGMDSVTMLYEYAHCIDLAVNFIYGSNHNMRELEFARLHCKRLGIELVEIDLSFIGENFHSSLLDEKHCGAFPQRYYAGRCRRSGREPRA